MLTRFTSSPSSSSGEQLNGEPDESLTLADLYSRMPPPPPRPPSIASLSSRNSNRPLSAVSATSSYRTQSQPDPGPSYGLTPPSPRIAIELAQQQRDRDSRQSEEQRQSWQSLTQSQSHGSISSRSSLRNSTSGNLNTSRRRTSKRDNELKGIGIERVPLPQALSSSSSSSLRGNGNSLPSSPKIRAQPQMNREDEKPVGKTMIGGRGAVRKFGKELGGALFMLVVGFLWPALLSVLVSSQKIQQKLGKIGREMRSGS